MTQIETISSEAEFANLAGPWDELVRSMGRPSPFLLHGWLLEWWRHYGGKRRLAVHVAMRGDRLVGALPLCRSRRFGLRVTEFIGGTKAPLADLMVAPDEDPATAARLAERILSSGGDFADLFGMPGNSRLATALPAGSLHALRWRGRRDPTGFGTPVGRAFHRAAMRRLAVEDVPRLVTLRLDGQPVAFSLYLLLQRTVYGVAMAFDPAFARYSPGTETLLRSLESAAAEGAERIEFLGAATPYKQTFTDRLEPIHEGIGLPSTLRGQVAVGLLVGGIRARRSLKRSETARRLYERVPRPARG